MKLPTKTLVTVLIVTALSMQVLPVAAASDSNISQRMRRQVERVQQHHDRKFELRAATLSMSPDELRDELKHKPLERILKERGFKKQQHFYVALQGKIREELHKRGLSDEYIKHHLLKRQQRAAENNVTDNNAIA